MFVLLGDISSVDEVRLEVLKLLYVDLVQGLFESMVFLQHNLCVDDVGSRARAIFAQYEAFLVVAAVMVVVVVVVIVVVSPPSVSSPGSN